MNININPGKSEPNSFTLRKPTAPLSIVISGEVIPWKPVSQKIKYLD